MSSHDTTCDLMRSQVMSCDDMWRHVTACDGMRSHGMSCDDMWRHVTACDGMRCHVINYTLTAKDPKQLFGIQRTLINIKKPKPSMGSTVSILGVYFFPSWGLRFPLNSFSLFKTKYGVYFFLLGLFLQQPIWDLNIHLPVLIVNGEKPGTGSTDSILGFFFNNRFGIWICTYLPLRNII